MSNRYRSVRAMMDDPQNLAILLREFERDRAKKVRQKALVVPFRTGTLFRYFPLRACLEGLGPDEEIGSVADLWEADGEWFFSLAEGDELGPFDKLRQAVMAAEDLLREEGFEILKKLPWDATDLDQFPLKVDRVRA